MDTWHPVTTPPELKSEPGGGLSSGPVLAVMNDGKLLLAELCAMGFGCPFLWWAYCESCEDRGERRQLYASVTHWMTLPQPPVTEE